MLCFHQCYYLASSFLIMFFFAENFPVERVLCWMLALYWHFGKKRIVMLLGKIVFFPGENIVQDVVFSYIKVVFAASRLPVRPLYICCGGNVKPRKDKGSPLKLHFQKETVFKNLC